MRKLFVTTILLVLLVFSHRDLRAASTDPQIDSLSACDTICDSVSVCQTERPPGLAIRTGSRGDQEVQAPEESFRKKKLITSILAFPIPFGFVGLHRIYLGTEPWVPIVYLCTGGGGFGLLPLIDFIYIVSADEDEFKKYENNPKLFMFVD